MKNALVSMSVPSVWDLVVQVRTKVASALSALHPELRDAAVMAAGELIENAIKYGKAVSGQPQAAIEVSIADGRLVLRVSSGVSSPDSAASTLDRIRAIREAPDKFALYTNRIRELMTSDSHSSQLGLFRIAAEGRFELSGSLEGEVLHVAATRPI